MQALLTLQSMNKISLKSVTKFMSCCPERRLTQTKSLYRKNGKHFKAIKSEGEALPFAVFSEESPGGDAAVCFRLVPSCQTPRPGNGQFGVHSICNLSVWPLFCVLLSKLIAQCLIPRAIICDMGITFHFLFLP